MQCYLICKHKSTSSRCQNVCSCSVLTQAGNVLQAKFLFATRKYKQTLSNSSYRSFPSFSVSHSVHLPAHHSVCAVQTVATATHAHLGCRGDIGSLWSFKRAENKNIWAQRKKLSRWLYETVICKNGTSDYNHFIIKSCFSRLDEDAHVFKATLYTV